MASKQAQKSDTSNIESYIRVRPLAPNENRATCLTLGRTEVLINSSSDYQKPTKTFHYDRVFDENSKQVVIYSTIIQPMIREVIQGYNCTVFAYGQTGTGKTYTMSGPPDDTISWKENIHSGIIPRALEDVFTQLSAQREEYKVSISFIELYNEKLGNLLSDSDEDTNIRLIDDLEGNVILKGLSPVTVQSRDEAFKLLQKGAEKRHVAATLMNMNSSRSHTIFTIYINVKESDLDKDDVLRLGKFHLVDLAGSENALKSGATEKVNKSAFGVNKRLAEASNINKSLLTLGRVITSITENSNHIPYRESNLTRLLRDSLGGKTKTRIIGTISPCQANLDETESTLSYAFKARSIKNKPEKNKTVTKKDIMQFASEELLKLKRDLEAIRQGDGFYISKEMNEEMTDRTKQLDLEVKNWHERYKDLYASFEAHKENFSVLKEDYDDKCAELDELLKIHQAETDRLKKDISRKRDELIIEEYLIKEYKKTENTLSEQAKQYNSFLKDILEKNGELKKQISRNQQIENKNVGKLDKFKEGFVAKEEDFHDCLADLFTNEKEFSNNICNSAGNVMDKLCDRESALKKYIADYKRKDQGRITDLVDCKEDMIRELKQLDSQESTMKEDISNQLSRTKELSSLFQAEAEMLYNEGNEILQVSSSVTKQLRLISQLSTPSIDFFQGHLKYMELAQHTLDEINEMKSSLELASNLVSESTELNSAAFMKAQELTEALSDFQSAISKSFADSTACQDKIHSVLEESSSVPENFQNLINIKKSLNCSIIDKLSEIKSSVAREEKENKEFETKLRGIQIDSNKFNMEIVNGLQNICGPVNMDDNLRMDKNKLSQLGVRLFGEKLDMEAEVLSRGRDEFSLKFEELLVTTDHNVDVQLRKQTDCVVKHSQSSRQFEELNNKTLCNLMKSVQEMKYLLDPSEGATLQPLNVNDLDWPTHSDPKPIDEALIEKLISEQELCEDAPSELNLQPISSPQFYHPSLDNSVLIRNDHLNTAKESPMSLKKFESLPNLPKVPKTSKANKENFCHPDTLKTSSKKAKNHGKKSGLPKPIR